MERIMGVKYIDPLEEENEEDARRLSHSHSFHVPGSSTAKAGGNAGPERVLPTGEVVAPSVPGHVLSAFEHFDADQNGQLDFGELREVLSYYGIDVAQPRAQEILSFFDERPDGKMDVGEFYSLVEQVEAGGLQEGKGHAAGIGAGKEGDPLPSHIISTFHPFDKNKSGHLDYRELRNALRFYGIDVTHPRAADFVKSYDDQPDGKMELHEFGKLVRDLEEGITRTGLSSRLNPRGAKQQRSAHSMLREIMARDGGKEELEAALRALDSPAPPAQQLAERPTRLELRSESPVAGGAPASFVREAAINIDEVRGKIASLFSPKVETVEASKTKSAPWPPGLPPAARASRDASASASTAMWDDSEDLSKFEA